MSGLWMDGSQHFFRQASDFGIHLLTGSKPYWFLEDRLATPQEVLCMMGLPRQLSLASVDIPVKWFDGAQHKRSTHLRDRETLLRDLVGNCVSQPDLAMVLTCALLAISGGPFGLQVPARFTDHNMDILYDWEIDPRTRRGDMMMSVELQYEANDRQADGRQIADTNGRTAGAQQTDRNDEYIRQMRRGDDRHAYGRGALSAFGEVSARRFLNAGQASSVRSQSGISESCVKYSFYPNVQWPFLGDPLELGFGKDKSVNPRTRRVEEGTLVEWNHSVPVQFPAPAAQLGLFSRGTRCSFLIVSCHQ